MTRGRVVAAALAMLALIGLLGWQYQRERLVKACLDSGGLWDGPQSACKPRPILQRDYRRSSAPGGAGRRARR
jgi:hypothetical protein